MQILTNTFQFNIPAQYIKGGFTTIYATVIYQVMDAEFDRVTGVIIPDSVMLLIDETAINTPAFNEDIEAACVNNWESLEVEQSETEGWIGAFDRFMVRYRKEWAD